MNKYDVVDLLFTMCDATSAAIKGATFDEVIDFVKRQHRDIEPEWLEAFRDALGPICETYKREHA